MARILKDKRPIMGKYSVTQLRSRINYKRKYSLV